MKRFALFFIFLSYSFIGISATITWDGGEGDGLWSTAANWVGNVVPGPSDDVVLDNSSLGGNYNVTLPDAAVTIISLLINPAPGNTITLLLPVTNTLITNVFVTTGTGYTVTLKSGAVFINNVSSGTNFTISDSFRINNGGQYTHRTRSGHAGWNSRLAKINGTETGLFEFDIPGGGSYPVSTSGNLVYGMLQLSSTAAGGTQTYTSNAGGLLTVNSDFIINSGVTYSYTPPVAGITFLINRDCYVNASSFFDLSFSGSNTMTLQLKKELNLYGTITESGSSVSTTVELNGTVNQLIKGTGSLLNTITLVMNNSAGATLMNPLTLPYNLALTSGKITTTSGSILTMLDDATYSGGSINSFINGPMKKRGDDNFDFPVGFSGGSGNIYAPIGIINFGGDFPGDEFKAEYKRANPQTTPFGPAHAGFLDHTSSVEYWTLEQTSGAASKNISLDVHLASFCLDLDNTYISRWNGSLWTYEPSSIFSGPVIIGINQTGVIKSDDPISGFTPPTIGFTLSTDLSYASNPLPITLISFDATKLSNTKSSLNWELAACCSSAAKFEMQRAGADKSFTTIGTVGGSETNKFYNYIDNGLKNGINYYRLKMIDADGKITYSRTVAVMNGVNGMLLTSLIPTVITNTSVLTVASSNQHKLDLIIVDMQGRVMMKRNYTITAGNTNIELQLNGLVSGVYQLTGISAEGKTNTLRFIKQ
jgi:hypothetical protein